MKNININPKSIQRVCLYCPKDENRVFGCKEEVEIGGEKKWVDSMCLCSCHRAGDCPKDFDADSHGICNVCLKKSDEEEDE